MTERLRPIVRPLFRQQQPKTLTPDVISETIVHLGCEALAFSYLRKKDPDLVQVGTEAKPAFVSRIEGLEQKWSNA